MGIGPNFEAFKISAKGMGIQKQKMDLVAENIANSDTTKTEKGTPYQRKFLSIKQNDTFQANFQSFQNNLKINTSQKGHINSVSAMQNMNPKDQNGMSIKVYEDDSQGELVFMPDHPDARPNGYVQMPNVNIVTEMVDMISATRNYQANVAAFNATKTITKDALEISS